jgi:hypothetical protein
MGIPEFDESRTVELTDGTVIERCEVCGERLAGEIAEVVRNCGNCGQKQDEHVLDPASQVVWCATTPLQEYTYPEHLIVHESCFDRETMEQA